MIKRCFVSKDRETLFWAFCVFVRPILEYASPVWSPHLIKDVDHVESVQRSFTKYLPGLSNKSYSERLKMLNGVSLEFRRLISDLSLTFSLLRGLCDLDYNIFFTLRLDSRTRGHPLKLVVPCAKRDCRKFFFSNRLFNIWNALPAEAVLAPSLHSFKRHLMKAGLDRYIRWK